MSLCCRADDPPRIKPLIIPPKHPKHILTTPYNTPTLLITSPCYDCPVGGSGDILLSSSGRGESPTAEVILQCAQEDTNDADDNVSGSDMDEGY